MDDAMNPLSPNQILRNLENGFFMTHREQEEAANYIRRLQEDIKTLGETVIMQAEEIVSMRQVMRQMGLWKDGRL
jgi:hypothetical protein